jgi:pimeloyl-ACP methyl ester carboxylesterase
MKVLVHGQLIEYKKEGTGLAVLLLHGWGSSLATFDGLAEYYVKKGHTVYRFDFPGFGGSPAPEQAWSVSEYVDITTAFLEKMKVSHLAVLGGHSFGGRVIIKGVATNELDADRLVLLGAAGIKPKRTFKKASYGIVAKIGKFVTSLPGLGGLRERLRTKLYTAAGSTDYLLAGPMQATFLKTINEDLTKYLPEIAVPTVLVWGENDTETPVQDGERMQADMQHAQLTVVPEAGHFVHQDKLDAVIQALKAKVQK